MERELSDLVKAPTRNQQQRRHVERMRLDDLPALE